MKFHETIISDTSPEYDEYDFFVSTDHETGEVAFLAESVDLKTGDCDTVKIPVADPVQLMNRLMGAFGCRIVNGAIVEAPKFKVGQRVRLKRTPRKRGTVLGVTSGDRYAVEWDSGDPYFAPSDFLAPDTDDFF